jgi:hypothetical protein
MEVEISNAAERFFPSPTFSQVFSESVTNALDAGATLVDILISVESFSKPETLKIQVNDNGLGFTDENWGRFKRLLKPRDNHHKGLGRLIYMRYFSQVSVDSVYGERRRKFDFSDQFQGKCTDETLTEPAVSGSILHFQGFLNLRFKSYDDLRPKAIKDRLMLELLPRLYDTRKKNLALKISITLVTEEGNSEKDFMNDSQVLTPDELPALREEKFTDTSVDLVAEFTMAYTVEKGFGKNTVVTAACVDDRTIDLKLIPPGSLPSGNSAFFLFYSDFFDGKADAARQKLVFEDEGQQRMLLRTLRKQVAGALSKLVSAVEQKNDETKLDFENKFPHLLGYFEPETVGIIQREEALEMAQRRFFKEQKAILESETMDEATYHKSLEVASRTLTEYILYRNRIIHKLKQVSEADGEKLIHNLICPQYTTFRGSDLLKGVYSNNAWVLDDKFMTFSTILSEARMDKVIAEILLKDEGMPEKGRPDISMIFSADPEADEKVDVVMVELKGRSDDEEYNLYAVTQLMQRADKLVAACPNIQRIWYYAVIQISPALGRRLTQMNWSPLFSKGQVFYQQFKTEAPDGTMVPTPTFVMSFDAIINDAEARNSTFLNILKEGIRANIKQSGANL